MKILSSYVTMLVLLALYAICMAVATFIEKAHGTMLAKVVIYYSPLFFLLQLMLVINFVMIVIRHRFLQLKRWGLLIVHFSFIVILLGALITHIVGKEGILHLREGEASDQVVTHTNRGRHVFILPFQVELVKFTLTRYPGSMSPSSYESELLVHVDGTTRREHISMNNVLDLKGYRFFQASFDPDEKGTVLSVNQDVAGRSVTYAGYLLLFIGCVGCLIGKNGRIRTLFQQLNRQKTASGLFLIALLFGFSGNIAANQMTKSMADAVQQLAVPAAHAKQFGALPVQSTNGRIVPVNTFSSEILRKLHKDTRFGALNSDQFLLSLLVMPEMWMNVPLITCSNNAVADYFSLPKEVCSYVDLFRTDGSYKLQTKLNEIYQKMPTERTGFDKEVIKLDEKANILHQLFEYQLINLFPKADCPNQNWYAPGDDLSEFSDQDSLFVSRIFYWYLSEVQEALQSGDWSKANEVLDMISTYQTAKNNVSELDMELIGLEVKYNQLDVFRWCRIGYLVLGGTMLLFSFLFLFRNKSWVKMIIRISGIVVLIVFHFQMMGMAMRWKIGGYAPWSNSYETMVFLAWSAVFIGLLFARRSPVTFSLSTLFAGIILFVSGLNWMDPQINPLVPVLKSPWLMYHVAILMAAYGFFGIGFLLGLVNLLMMAFVGRLKKHSVAFAASMRELSIINEIALIAGLILMTVGSFMGAVWANESWGRYWGWDPKETWALITIIVYVIVTHLHLVRKWYSAWLLNLCSVVAFVSVLMTYFGVNFFLSGLHSYGHRNGGSGVFVYLCGAVIFVLLLAVMARKGAERMKSFEPFNLSQKNHC
jgi:cytochrome c-type biogenesis protein CcsB